MMAKKEIKEGDLLKFTMNCEHVAGVFGPVTKVKQGQQGMAGRLYTDLLGFVVRADIKLPDGTLLKEVPSKYWTI